jgi:hypothetical protein
MNLEGDGAGKYKILEMVMCSKTAKMLGWLDRSQRGVKGPNVVALSTNKNNGKPLEGFEQVRNIVYQSGYCVKNSL